METYRPSETTPVLKIQPWTPLSSDTLQARLGTADGPIMVEQDVDVFELNPTQYSELIEILDDGSWLFKMDMAFIPIIPDLDIHIHIFWPGVTFPDGTIDHYLTTADFVNGLYAYQIVRHAETTDTCHYMRVYQNGVQVSF